ncbi:hypothetical protein KJ611_04055 [Patescibacteria group bacterium]|nr:hypothetical protein [Patescibacteria group bacterium]MBU1705624.1 hypothetical protein [Patescibacteria group bacterium]
MRSLYILWLLTFMLGCQSRQETRTTRPYPTKETVRDQEFSPGIPGPIPLNHSEAGLPFGESEIRTIGRMMLSEPATYRSPQADNIVSLTKPGPIMEKDVAEALEKAAASLAPEYGILLVTAYRSMADQETLIRQNCENPPGFKSCQPKLTYQDTCLPASNLRNTCPHTSGRAVDVFGLKKVDGEWQQCITQSQCLMSLFGVETSAADCAQDPCQAVLITAMKRQGFCLSNTQPWHFENPQISRNCYF